MGEKVLYRNTRYGPLDKVGEVLEWSMDGKITVIDLYTEEVYRGLERSDYKLYKGEDCKLDEGEEDSEGVSQRFNQGKPELSYILDANYAIEGICDVMSFGATKYERDNWKLGFPKEKLADSLLRHLTKFLSGEELDEESGLPHVDHIGCNALFLAYHYNGRKHKAESDEE